MGSHHCEWASMEVDDSSLLSRCFLLESLSSTLTRGIVFGLMCLG